MIFVTTLLVTGAPDVAKAILAGGKGSKKPILSCFLGSHGVPESLRSLNEGHIPSYAFPEAAAHTLARVAEYGRWRSADPGSVPKLRNVNSALAREILKSAVEKLPALAEGAENDAALGWLPPELIVPLLGAYGIGTPGLKTAANRGEAAAAGKQIGFPVAMKVKSPDVVHKTDVGGVKLNLRTEEEAARAFDEIRISLRKAMPDARFDGVTVEPMVMGGIETIIGMNRDPLFGPVVLFGLGGVAVELLRDVSVRVAPLSDRDAAEMLGEFRGAPLLDGYRGAPPVNKGLLARPPPPRVAPCGGDPEVMELNLNRGRLPRREARTGPRREGPDRLTGGHARSRAGQRRGEGRFPRPAHGGRRVALSAPVIGQRLRPEEAMTLAFYVILFLALAAMSASNAVLEGPAAKYPGSASRLAFLVVSVAGFLALIQFRPQWDSFATRCRSCSAGTSTQTCTT